MTKDPRSNRAEVATQAAALIRVAVIAAAVAAVVAVTAIWGWVGFRLCLNAFTLMISVMVLRLVRSVGDSRPAAKDDVRHPPGLNGHGGPWK